MTICCRSCRSCFLWTGLCSVTSVPTWPSWPGTECQPGPLGWHCANMALLAGTECQSHCPCLSCIHMLGLRAGDPRLRHHNKVISFSKTCLFPQVLSSVCVCVCVCLSVCVRECVWGCVCVDNVTQVNHGWI